MLKGKLKLPLPVPDKARRAFPDRLGSLVAGFDGKEEEYGGGSDLVVFEPGEELETFQPNGFVSDKESDGVENFVEDRPRPEKDGAGPVSTVQVIAVDEKRSDLEYEIREYCNFTPKDLSPFSVTTAEEPYTSRYLALLNNHLYSVGGYAELTRSEFEELRGGEDYPLHGIYMPSRSVWTLDLTCPDLGWKQFDVPMRNRRKDPQTIVVDGKLYVFGGLYGYKPIPEDCSSGRGWMEVYDPILKTWESLPNPPFSIAIGGEFEPIIFAHLELEEDKHEIMVVDLSNSKENNMCADFLKYNVVSSTWETWLQQHWASVDSYTQCGRAVVVDHTKAYWACIISMEKWNTECCIFGFDLKSKRWTRERLNPGPFLGESEYFCWTSPGLLHLSDHKFCLLLSSRNSSHEPSEKASNFLFCIVLDLSAFFYIYSDPDRKPPLSVISIQKYSLDTDIDLLDCMITNRGTQPPKKKKPKTSEEKDH